MTCPLIVTGTDTGIGKTIFSAGLTQALAASYWKPVQSGLDEETDSETVARLSGCKVLPEAYRLKFPASPHLSAAREGVEITANALALPQDQGVLVVEGAGGALVPLHGDLLYADVMAAWEAPVIVVARTSLGTINHSLLTIEALRARGLPLLGVAFVGAENADSQSSICRLGQTRSLGRLPIIPDLTRTSLAAAFLGIDLATIRGAL